MDGLKFPGCFVSLAAALVAGCAGLPADRGRGDVAALLKERGRDVSQVGDQDAAARLTKELTAKPLGVDDAVSLALVNNPRLRAQYARLGIAAADVYEAGRLSNPRLSASILFVDEPGLADKLDFGLSQSFTSLLLLPARSRFAEGEFERVKALVGADVLDLAAEVEAAWYGLAGAWQVADMREAVARAAAVSADLAQRFFDAGNINRRELALEKAAAAQAQLDAEEAAAAATRARIGLGRLMGLPALNTPWKIAAGLPTPMAEEDAPEALIKRADAARLDLAAVRSEVAMRADALGVTRRFRYLGDVDVGLNVERDTDGSFHRGPALSLELPLFNQNADDVERAEAQLARSEAELAALEIDIVSGVHDAHAQVLAAKARAERYRSALIPLREAVVARTQEEVNFMLEGQFQLLLVKQQEYDAYQGFLEAVRDYWLARVELARNVGAALPGNAQAAGEVLDAEALTRPRTEAGGGGMQMNHEGMPMSDSDDGMKDMPGDGMKEMDHSGHGGAARKKAAPKKDAAPAMPPPRKGGGPSDMPTGMESHIPEPAAKSDPAQTKPDESQQHGDHP